MIIFYFIVIYNNYNWIINNNEIRITTIIKTLILETSFNVNKLFNFPNFIINLLIIRYLLFILNVVIKITNFQFGPLRNKI